MRKYRASVVHDCLSGVIACLVLVVACNSWAGGSPSPNVLLIVLDDFGFNDLAINNNSDSPTPNLDALAREGLRFSRHYTESSCAPSRAALLTGRYPAKLGFHPSGPGLSAEVRTLPEILAAEGYATAAIGKWHIGEKYPGARPLGQGFSQWFGFTNQMYLAGPHSGGEYTRGQPTYLNPWLEEDDAPPREYQGHLTEILTRRGVDYVSSATGPWFLYLSYYAPHSPIQPSSQFAEQFPATEYGRYQALKAQLDDAVGQILTALKQSNQHRNTLIVVVSDNGGTARHYPSNAPFDGAKAGYLEGGIRTPLVMYWADNWSGGEALQQPVMITDIAPTILHALSIPVPAEVDGRDMFVTQPQRPLRWFSHHGAADSYGLLDPTAQWLFSSWLGAASFLYSSTADPTVVSANMIEEESQLALDLAADAESWSREVTRVELQPQFPDARRTVYAGDEFRRTPIAGTWSFGMVVSLADSDPEKSVPIVAQEGYLELTVNDDALHLILDSHEMTISLPEQRSECTTIAVTAYLTKSHQVFYRPDDESLVRVYIDGVMRQEVTFANPELNPHPPTNPLIVFNAGSGTAGVPRGVAPFLSTRMIQDKEMSAIVHPGLKERCVAILATGQ